MTFWDQRRPFRSSRVSVGRGLKLTASPSLTPFKSALLRLCKGRAGTQEVKVVERLGGVSDGIELNVVDNPVYVHTTLTTLHKMCTQR